ncbi:MAG: hypothetical protein E6982_10615 [Clostridium sp.]|nr:hypothetical protein [Clostridium paraputrificum]MDU1180047.1 hypothetical protein [Clostridium sp.]
MKVGKIMRKENKSGVDWSNPEQVREWHRQYNAKHNKLNYAKNKEYWKEYYLKHKDKHKASMSKKDGKWIYAYISPVTMEVIYIGSFSSLYRFSRQKCCEFAKELIDSKTSYVIVTCNLDKYIKELKDLRLVEDTLIRRLEPKLNDINACAEVDDEKVYGLFDKFYKDKMQVVEYKLFDKDKEKKEFVEAYFNNAFSLFNTLTYKAFDEIMLNPNIKSGDYYYNFIENKMYLKENN